MTGELAQISPFSAYLESFLGAGIPAVVLMVMAVALHWLFLLTPLIAALAFLDRKIGADVQMRIGPNRVSPFGLAQSLADTVKNIFKENGRPSQQEPMFYRWGSIAAIVCVFIAIGNIPMGSSLALSNQDCGAIIVIIALGISRLFMFWMAYAAESHWSVLSSFRVLAQLATYMVPIAIALLPAFMISGSASLDAIVRSQGGLPWRWIAFHNPGTMLTFVTMFLGLLIWQARSPFDQHGGNADAGGGFEAEHSGIRKGLLSCLEYGSFFLACGFLVTTYLGGWQTPFNLESFGRASNIVEWLFFVVKMAAMVFLSIWIRWSLPRMGINQIVDLSWKILVPFGLAGSAITAVWMVVFKNRGLGDFI